MWGHLNDTTQAVEATSVCRRVEFLPLCETQEWLSGLEMSPEPPSTPGWLVDGWNFNFDWPIPLVTNNIRDVSKSLKVNRFLGYKDEN